MQTTLTDNLIPRFIPENTKSVRLHFEFEDERRKMTADEFWEFCAKNPKLRAELTKEGDVIIMPPTGFETSDRNAEIIFQLKLWAKNDKTGIATESNAGFVLPNGATRSPDAAWTQKKRLEKFTEEERQKFLSLCPDFVVELRSASDTLKGLKDKLEEFIENGARLGWLIDPKNKTVYVYRPNSETEILKNPETLSGEDVLENFQLDLKEIW